MRLQSRILVKIMRLCLVKVTKLNLGQYSEARFGQDLNLRFSRCLVEILKLMLSRDSEIVICSICL